VENVMHAGEELPQVQRGTLLKDALMEMTRKGLGMTVILEADGKLAGIFTDGDLRRTLDRSIDIHSATIDQVMTVHGKTARAEMLAAEALKIMEDHKNQRTGGRGRRRPPDRRLEHARLAACRSDVMSADLLQRGKAHQTGSVRRRWRPDRRAPVLPRRRQRIQDLQHPRRPGHQDADGGRRETAIISGRKTPVVERRAKTSASRTCTRAARTNWWCWTSFLANST
jgi:CBS domain-containing protein